jgi:hypothetical protein
VNEVFQFIARLFQFFVTTHKTKSSCPSLSFLITLLDQLLTLWPKTKLLSPNYPISNKSNTNPLLFLILEFLNIVFLFNSAHFQHRDECLSSCLSSTSTSSSSFETGSHPCSDHVLLFSFLKRLLSLLCSSDNSIAVV